MRLIVTMLIVPLTLCLASVANAQEDEPLPVTTIDFLNGLTVEGIRIVPEEMIMGDITPGTTSLLQIRGNFVDVLVESTDDLM